MRAGAVSLVTSFSAGADEYADAYWTEVAYGPQEKCEVSVLKGSPPATCATRRTSGGAEDPAG